MDAWLMRNSSWWRAAVRRSGESRSFAVAFGLGAAVGAPYALYTALSWATDFAARGATQAAAQDMQRNEQLRLGAQANKARLASLLAEFDPANAGKQNDSAQKDRWAQAMQGKFAARGERAGMQLGETEPRLVYGNKGSKKGAQADCEGAKPSRWRAWLGGRGEAGSEAAQKA